MAGSRSASAASRPWALPALSGRAWRRRIEGPRLFLLTVAALLAALLVWAALAEVHKVVRVEGRLIPAGRAQQIQHLEGGIVAAIHVAEGGAVAKGQLLLTIDDTGASATLSETGVKLAAQKVRAARLQREAAGAGDFTLPADLAGNPAAQAESQLFRARHAALEQQVRVHQEQIRQRTAELREVEARRQRLAGELATARKRSELVTAMAARNAASQLEVLDAQSREQRLTTELGDAEASLPKLRAAIDESQARIEQARASFQSEAQGDLTAALVEIDRLTQIGTAQSDRVFRTEVRAPVDGIINRIAVNTVGGVVRPGDSIVEITPTTEQVLIEARARPSDRGELRAGLEARVRVSAHDVGALGPLDGRVTEVSADTMQEPRGESFYRVVIRVDQLPPSYAGRLLAPGMTITADVVTGQRTVLDHITSPLRKFSYNAFQDAR